MPLQHQQCNNLLTGVNLYSEHFTNRDKIKKQLTDTILLLLIHVTSIAHSYLSFINEDIDKHQGWITISTGR